VIQKTIHLTYRTGRRIAIAVLGSTVLVLGIVMIVAPGPALIVIPIGLAILGIEFAWARLWLKRLRETISKTFSNRRAKKATEHQDRVSQ
jgi:tellurite resistance protein TerC